MADLNFRITFYYFGSKDIVPNLEYRIQTNRDILRWTPELGKKWPLPKVIPARFLKKTNPKGETEPFKVSGVCTIEVYVKGKPTPFNQWTLVKKIHVNENFLHLKTIEYPLKVTIPVSKLGKAVTADKSNASHQSDYYQVQSGDTLETIAKKFKKNINELMSNNGIKDQNKINKFYRLLPFYRSTFMKKVKFEMIGKNQEVKEIIKALNIKKRKVFFIFSFIF